MAMEDQDASGINFERFERRLDIETLNDGQKAMLNTRLQLLKSFMNLPLKPGYGGEHQKEPKFAPGKKGDEQKRQWHARKDAKMRAQIAEADVWSFKPGTLTIVDLSCPFVDESAACAMFNICLALFLDKRAQAGRIVALDEAHKVGQWGFRLSDMHQVDSL